MLKKSIWITAGILGAFATSIVARVEALNSEPLGIEDLLSSREFLQLTVPVLSPNHDLFVYGVRDEFGRAHAHAGSNSNIPASASSYLKDVDLYAVDTRSGETQSLTGGIGGNWAPSWSPDGHFLAFLSDRDGSGIPRLWLWERSTGKLRKLSDAFIRSPEIQWLSSREVVITIASEDASTTADKAQPYPRGSPLEQAGVDRPTVRVYRSAAISPAGPAQQIASPWDLDTNLKDLAIIEIQSGAMRRLTRDRRIARYRVSPDGSYVAFSTPLRFELPGSQQIRWDLAVVSVATSEAQTLASDIRLEYDGSPFSWSPDGSRLAYLTGGPMEHRTGRGDCFIVELKGGGSKNVSEFKFSADRYKQHTPLWSSTGQTLYLVRAGAVWMIENEKAARKLSTIGGRRVVELVADDHDQVWSPDNASMVALTYDNSGRQSGFYKVDLTTGKSTRLLENGQCYQCENVDVHVYAVAGGEDLAYFAEDAGHHSDLWLSDANFRSSRRLTNLNPQLDKYKLGQARLVQWQSLDGRVLEGSLLLPPDYHEGTRYPLIVWVYAGDRGSDFVNRFGLASDGAYNFQLLATRGYAVLFPDVPDDPSTPMLNIAKCVLPGISHLVEAGIADPNRLGVIGQSYGGYSVLALLAQTNRFKAAVEIDGIGNLISLYGEMDKDGEAFGVSQEQEQGSMGGSPWQVRDKYIENSPYFYLDRVESPLLIVHGAEDTTVAPFLADELFVALRRLGKEVEYAKYEGEGHSVVYWKYSNQADYCRRMLSWFQQHLAAAGNGSPP